MLVKRAKVQSKLATSKISMTNVLKLAARFEKMLRERQLSEDAKEKNEEELLSELVNKYNSYKANSALKRWQISADQYQAIWAIIIGMDETSRSLLRAHLDHNKWEESGSFAAFSVLGEHVCFSG